MSVSHARAIGMVAALVTANLLCPPLHVHAQTPGEVRAQELRVQADQGDSVAEYTIAMMYADGDGVEQNDVEALALFIRAVSHAFGEDFDVYSEQRDALAARMTEEDVAEARRIASEWEPTPEP